MIQRVYLGKRREEYAGFPDAKFREIAILAPFAVLAIAMGILPTQTVFAFTNGTLNQIVDLFGKAAPTMQTAMATLLGH